MAKIFTEQTTGVLYITQISSIFMVFNQGEGGSLSEIQRELLVLAHMHSFGILVGKFRIHASCGHLGSVSS